VRPRLHICLLLLLLLLSRSCLLHALPADTHKQAKVTRFAAHSMESMVAALAKKAGGASQLHRCQQLWKTMQNCAYRSKAAS